LTRCQPVLREATGARAAVYIVGSAVALRVLYWWATFDPAQQPSSELLNVARSVALTGHFADPYAVPTGPTAHVPPAYPLLLAATSKLLGGETAIGWLARIFSLTCAGAVWALMPAAAERLRLPRPAGALAGYMGALWLARFPAEDANEAAMSALASWAWCFGRRRWWDRDPAPEQPPRTGPPPGQLFCCSPRSCRCSLLSPAT
jgi:hypothetical protein